ncbi:hypothetical protein DMN91_008110 [Ooceraea biroi]|uniref:THAP domain-containing protein n=1 Tax=Ooceraea biroi TaxID=2015173 RepID=A0A026VZL2_OOCBI|nr:THAP domain-containing protein 11 [Ooceraea biroi]EZA48314.1 THAP domain-containing protein [Ooceraea biroi]RLU19553.1 hypothetical protein DMN91_008110 [Ooceraea biroi]
MTGCSAPFCNNSSKKGYVMKVFPRDAERRAIWAQNVDRADWEPTNNSCLCEVHFPSEMWERRADKKRKLKQNAVPTIFGFFWKKKVTENEKEVSPIKEVSSEGNRVDYIVRRNESESNQPIDVLDEECQIINDSSETNDLSTARVAATVQPDKQTDDETMDNNIQKQNCQIANDSEPTSRVSSTGDSDRREIAKLEETIRKQYLCLIKLRKNIKALRNTIQTMKNKSNDNKYKKALSSFLTEDQIQALFTETRRVRPWSMETIKRALHLKSVCGTNGYEELIRQGIPFPSLRTLRRII